MRKTLCLHLFAVLLLCLMPAALLDAAPKSGSPTDVIRLIYADHQPWAGKNIDLSDTVTMAKYFDPSLIALFKKDQDYSEKMHEIGCLDWDPFLQGQDYDESGTTPIKIREVKSKTGVLYEVTFTGRSEAWKNWNVRVRYDVRKTPNGWRIYDLFDKDGDSLRNVLSCNLD
jgi:hypothetical protein